MKVIVITGKSDSGKTTLIEQLIPFLAKQGLQVGVIKHCHCDFEIDHKGKDTQRYAEAGAGGVLICSPEKSAFIERNESEPSLGRLLKRYFDGYDLVLVEGYRASIYPKVQVCRQGNELPSEEDIRERKIVALVIDEKGSFKIPCFGFRELDRITQFIINNAVLPNSLGE